MKLSDVLKVAVRFSGGKRPPPPPAPRFRESSGSGYRITKMLWAAMVTGLLFGTTVVQVFWPASPWLDVLRELREASGIEAESAPRLPPPAVAPQGPAPR